MILGWPYPKRVKLIQDLLQTQTGKTYGIRFQGKLQYLQIYSIPIELPKYRLKNGRTAAVQIEFLAKNPAVEKDIFAKDPESEKAQEIQHSLLKAMVNNAGLFDYFKNNEQEIPLVLTNGGFIVNGNRRVCAMRELFEEDPKTFERFKNIDVIILPPSDEDDIDRLEAREQIHPDITADYSWVTQAVMYRERMKEHKQGIQYITSVYDVTKSEVTELLDMLAHGEAYLKDRGQEGQYSEIEDDEYAFRQLRKYRRDLQTEAKKSVYDQLAYTIIDKPEGDRTYKTIADTAKHFDRIVDSIKTTLDIKPETPSQGVTQLLGGGPSGIVAAVLTTLRDESKRIEVRDIIREVLTSESEKERESKKANFVLLQVRKAALALDDATHALNKDGTKNGIADLLKQIEEAVAKIEKWVHGKAVH